MKDDRFYLCNEPELVRAVGGLMISISQMEAILIPTLAALLKTDLRTAAAIFENIENVSARLAIVFELAALQPKTGIGAAVLANQASISKAIAKRNSLAHGQIGRNEKTGKLVLASNLISKRRGGMKVEPISEQELVGHSQNISNAMALVSIEFGDTDITPRHREKGQPQPIRAKRGAAGTK